MAVEVVERRNFPGRVVQFYHEVQDEMRKVTWPDRAQLKDTTIKIIIFVLFLGAGASAGARLPGWQELLDGLAQELGFSAGDIAELHTLELAGLFHDIGKIGVPSEIIRKPGPLTPEERQIMNQHTIIGEQILAPVAFLDSIRHVVRSCHERWDGEGYAVVAYVFGQLAPQAMSSLQAADSSVTVAGV